MPRLTGRTGAVVGLACAAVLLFGTISIGLRVPGTTFLDPFGSDGSLDYRALRFGRFAPLRGDFIARELGSVIAEREPAAPARRAPVQPVISSFEPPEPVAVRHLFTNDDFVDAYPVSSVPFSARTNTSGAEKQGGEPTGCAPVGGTAWYRYRATQSIGLIANTFGSGYATALGVYSGSSMSDLRSLGCDTDTGGNAQVAFAAQRGVTYWFQIAGPFGGGDLVFNLKLQGVTTRASVTSRGGEGDADSLLPAISGDGRFVTFYSGSRTLTPSTPPPPPCVATAYFDACRPGVFLRNRESHRMSRVDRASGALVPTRQVPPEDVSITGSLSSDGRYVGFYSTHNTLIPDDFNDTWDVFVHDQRSGRIRRVSVSSAGTEGNMASFNAVLSADGRFVAFSSAASNLVPDDTTLVTDVFLHDIRTSLTSRVSVASNGNQANETRSAEFPLEAGSHLVSLSANGRYVLFRSNATNLVRGDTNDAADFFLHDTRTHTTERISVSSAERQGNGESRQPLGIAQWAVSDDGRFAFFNSDASNLVAGDSNGAEDLFVRDRVRGTTRRVSVSSTGAEANTGVGEQDAVTVYRNVGLNLFVDPINGTQTSYSATPDGRYVAFSSGATSLVPGDGNGVIDVFLRHLPTGTTTLLSVTSTGEQGDGASNAPVLSADAGFVAFQSAAGNLVPEDSNGNEDIFTHEVPHGQHLSGWH